MARLVAQAYSASVGAVAGVLLALEWLRVGPATPIEFLYLALLVVVLVPLAILLVSTMAYLVLGPRPLPRVNLDEFPRVALLYAVYNDTVPEAIALTLSNLDYPNAEVWLLSDSDNDEALRLERALPPRVRLFRRPVRRGGKAGALNDWLQAHGAGCEYIVPMDADTALAPGSLRRLVEMAEHPENWRYGGFQSLMEVHPLLAPTGFARVMGRSVRYGSRIIPLVNQRLFGQGMYWGSNALLRRTAVEAAGGWVEDNVCEDFALTARLDAAGFPIAVVDLYNYEGYPADALSLRERTVRWCEANLSVAPSVFHLPTGFAVRLNVALPLLFYALAPALLLLVVLGTVAPLAPSPRFTTLLGVSLLAFVFFHRAVALPGSPLTLRAFLTATLLETLVVLGMSLRVTGALLLPLLRRPRWNPSRKKPLPLSSSAAVRASLPEVALGLLLGGLVGGFHPPAPSAALALAWVVSFLSTPLLLWLSARPIQGSKLAPRGVPEGEALVGRHGGEGPQDFPPEGATQ